MKICKVNSKKTCKYAYEDNARQAGFEPATYRLEVCCSIQLSYWRIFCFEAQAKPDASREKILSLLIRVNRIRTLQELQ